MCTLDNIDRLTAALAVPRAVAGVAFVRAPDEAPRNFPLLVLYAEPVGIIVQTRCLQVTADQTQARVVIGDYPPVVPKPESGVIVQRGGLDALIAWDDAELARRDIPGDRQWCGSLTASAGADRLTKKLRKSAVLDLQLNDLTKYIQRRWGLA